jgi:hypothetical protein
VKIDSTNYNTQWVTPAAGTVTSVGASGPVGILTWSAAVTASGTLTATLATQTANTVLAGPTSGAAAVPTFRALVAGDVPSLDAGKITTGQLALARGGTAADLSATGGTSKVVMQEGAGSAFTVRILAAGDIPDLSATYAKLAAANTFTKGPQTVQIDSKVNAGIVLKSSTDGLQSANTFEFRRGSDSALLAYFDSLFYFAHFAGFYAGRPTTETQYTSVGNTQIGCYYGTAGSQTRRVLFGYDPNVSPSPRATLYADGTGGGIHFYDSAQIGIGNTWGNNQLLVQFVAPFVILQARDAVTGAVTNAATVRHTLSSGTATAGFGVSFSFQLDSSTTANRAAADEIVEWATATDASRLARRRRVVYDGATAREACREEAVSGGVNVSFFGAGSWGGGVGTIFLPNAGTTPGSNPTGGGILYATGGALHWLGSSGTNTTLGAADPHCPRCGKDYALEWKNGTDRLAVCVWCLVQVLNKHGIHQDDFLIP